MHLTVVIVSSVTCNELYVHQYCYFTCFYYVLHIYYV